MALAVLALVTLGGGCVEPMEEVGTPASKADDAEVTTGAGPPGERPPARHTGFALPPYLGGYPAVSKNAASRVQAWAGSSGQSCGARDPRAVNLSGLSKAETAVYAATDGRPALWVVVFRGPQTGGGPWGIGGDNNEGRCRDLDYVIQAGGLLIGASRVSIQDVGDARLLRTRVAGGVSIVIACVQPLQDSTCSAAMGELIHFLGV